MQEFISNQTKGGYFYKGNNQERWFGVPPRPLIPINYQTNAILWKRNEDTLLTEVLWPVPTGLILNVEPIGTWIHRQARVNFIFQLQEVGGGRQQTFAEVVFLIVICVWEIWLVLLEDVRRNGRLQERGVSPISVMRAVGIKDGAVGWTGIFLFRDYDWRVMLLHLRSVSYWFWQLHIGFDEFGGCAYFLTFLFEKKLVCEEKNLFREVI